jgi:thioredoxin reductase (NADPH)
LERDCDLLIGGGGIAGLTAGMTAARLGRKVLILTGDMLGGHLLSIEKIDGFPGFPEGVAGYDLCPMAQEQAAEAGAELAMTGIERIERQADNWRVTTGEGERTAGGVIVATGTILKELGIPGEAEFRGKGVSHCASCDAPLLRDRTVAVVGGGDSAMQEALTLAATAGRVIILHRGKTLSAQAAYRDRVSAHERIEVRHGAVVEEILGTDTVGGLRLEDGEIEVDGVFIYIGLEPNTGFLDGQLSLDGSGHIVTDNWMRTQAPGLFAAGTVRAGSPGRAVASAGEGASAAQAADKYLADGMWC